MQFSTVVCAPERIEAGCAIVPVLAGGTLTASGLAADRACGGALSRVIARGDLPDKAGSTLLVQADGALQRVVLVAMGDEPVVSERAFVDAARAALRELGRLAAHDALSLLDEVPLAARGTAWKVRQQVLLADESAYRFERMKSKPDKAVRGPRSLAVAVAAPEQAVARAELDRAAAIAEGVALAKDLGNLPGNVCTPAYLAEQAQALAERFKLRCEVLDAKKMGALGMGALLAVSQGSRQPPQFIVLQYRGAAKSAAPVVLVGKGITFDTGGISIKPAAEMDEMKYDMCGAASVLGALHAAARMKLAVNVVGLVPTCENMPDGAAVKPGDVVTSLSGQTIEILNTDAEGRLILADALTYAKRFKPAAVLDIATLTGACVVALGHHNTGLFTKQDALAAELIDAGRETRDTVWRMPLEDDYQEALKSPFADMANVGGRAGGAITAACFLSRFAKDYDWAHLDIAGTAWKSGAHKGATGRPVALLARFLAARAER